MKALIARAALAAATTVLELRQARRGTQVLQQLTDAQLEDMHLTRSDMGRVTFASRRWHAV